MLGPVRLNRLLTLWPVP